ncbi:tryptophan synthase subunit beta [soil metagenome]
MTSDRLGDRARQTSDRLGDRAKQTSDRLGDRARQTGGGLGGSRAVVDSRGRFGDFGGRYVPESLMGALDDLERAWGAARDDPSFEDELDALLADVVGRPTPLYEAERLSVRTGTRVLLKREDLAHTGAHKINNTLGQVLLARRMGKRRIIAETGASQHGVATATAAALFGVPCVVYMGATDVKRQRLNVVRMHLLGAQVVPVATGSATLKDAINEALRDWVTNVEDTHYVIGSVVGPHPYPEMVAALQRVIGDEARSQVLGLTGGLPDEVVACVGGGSNAVGLWRAFYGDDVAIVGVEAAGEGLDASHGAAIARGTPGILHGARSMLLQSPDGLVTEAHSISAGLDYPGVGPEHAWLAGSRRATYVTATDREAVDAVRVLAATEGIIPALEPAHAIAHVLRRGGDGETILVCLSGRGDKDVATVADALRG